MFKTVLAQQADSQPSDCVCGKLATFFFFFTMSHPLSVSVWPIQDVKIASVQ